jgi:hypothetical protein
MGPRTSILTAVLSVLAGALGVDAGALGSQKKRTSLIQDGWSEMRHGAIEMLMRDPASL